MWWRAVERQRPWRPRRDDRRFRHRSADRPRRGRALHLSLWLYPGAGCVAGRRRGAGSFPAIDRHRFAASVLKPAEPVVIPQPPLVSFWPRRPLLTPQPKQPRLTTNQSSGLGLYDFGRRPYRAGPRALARAHHRAGFFILGYGGILMSGHGRMIALIWPATAFAVCMIVRLSRSADEDLAMLGAAILAEAGVNLAAGRAGSRSCGFRRRQPAGNRWAR